MQKIWRFGGSNTSHATTARNISKALPGNNNNFTDIFERLYNPSLKPFFASYQVHANLAVLLPRRRRFLCDDVGFVDSRNQKTLSTQSDKKACKEKNSMKNLQFFFLSLVS